MIIVIIIVFLLCSAFFYAGYRFGQKSKDDSPVITPSGVYVSDRKKLTMLEWEELNLKKKKRIESVFDNDGGIDEDF